MSDYTDLQKAAEYAAQDAIKFADEDEEMRALQQFHEEVDPETVLALIAENERNQRMVLSACMSMGAIGESLGLDMDSDGDEMLGMVAELKAERDQLRAEVAGLRTGYEAYEQVNAELKAENEALRNALRPLLANWDDLKPGESINVDAARAALGQGEQS